MTARFARFRLGLACSLYSTYIPTNLTVAIKTIDLENSQDEIDDIQQEIAVMAACSSPHVTEYYGSIMVGPLLWIVMEYLGGGSAQDLLRAGAFRESYIAIIMRELLVGLEYLHGQNMIHRDIKAANVLVGSDGAVKLADFGVSGMLTDYETKRHTFVGTPYWMAPEVIVQAGYSTPADIWSLGITAIELAKTIPPLSDVKPMKALFFIPKNAPPVLRGKYSTKFKSFVAACLVKEPKDRPSASDLLQHKFIRSAKKTSAVRDLIKKYNRFRISNGENVWRKSQSRAAAEEAAAASQSSPHDIVQVNAGPSLDEWDFETYKPPGKDSVVVDTASDASSLPDGAVLNPAFEDPDQEAVDDAAPSSVLATTIGPVLASLLKSYPENEPQIAALQAAFEGLQSPQIGSAFLTSLIATLRDHPDPDVASLLPSASRTESDPSQPGPISGQGPASPAATYLIKRWRMSGSSLAR